MSLIEESLGRLERLAQESRSHKSMLLEVREVEASLRALDVATEVWVTITTCFHIGYVNHRGRWRIVIGERWWSNPFTGIPRRKLLVDADRVECARGVSKLPELIEAVSAEVRRAFKPGETE